jgi:3-hydroxyacyl-[acyl-carrier-protein] dehydratase
LSQILTNVLTKEQILNYLPQQPPFRFVDQILDVNNNNIIGTYKFKKTEYFYAGHFPNNPITPGVILLEAMCQVGVVALGIYLLSLEVSSEEINNWLTMFTDAKVEFYKSVHPEDTVIIKATKIFWRKMKLKSNIEMYDQNQNLLATAAASGIGVRV